MGFQGSTNPHKKPSHQREDSGELDVFEASRYFSGSTNVFISSTTTQKPKREDRFVWGGERKSLDMAMNGSKAQPTPTSESQRLKEKKKKQKQPLSPGGRLARILSSLFTQTTSSKKKSKPNTTTHSDRDESPVEKRKRRSSISGSTSSCIETKSIYSSSSTRTGFRSPPLYNSNTHTKFYNVREHRRAVEIKEDDGEESDSSSDLFELKIYDLGGFPSGLPVYETTQMGGMKKEKGASNGATTTHV
ncbi:hypothetical protein QJS04_geneDACA021458 [Acorus gramineus]|uniref:Protein BIG GRAIN 1-like E n=1 Tax=Acorus gramineus TaxID=55184 RepID=A0AAV9BBB2_ACOGR|nr:hypothetical protein QJS04_geneDACA021458 [Acorus gramineus]